MGAGGSTRRTALAALLGALVAVAGGMPARAAAPAADAIDLAAYRGKVVYLDFWASWCVPCRESFPWMNGMLRQYGKDGLVVVAVNMDQVHTDATAFLQKYPADFTVRFDPAGQLAEQFKVRGMPTSALLARDGHTLFVHEGFRAADRNSLEQRIRDALK